MALVWGTAVGFGAAVALSIRSGRVRAAPMLLAALVWVTPTFLLLTLLVLVEGTVHGLLQVPVGAGYGEVTPGQVVLPALVLGLRPAVYLVRQAGEALIQESTTDYVRAARARGLNPARIYYRYVVRIASSGLIISWLNTARTMVGSLPLVEFFFAYPGLGQQLVLALGISYPNQGQATSQPDLAVGLVTALAGILLVIEALAAVLRWSLDPRLREEAVA